MKSIIQNNKECYVCGIQNNLNSHHVFFGNPLRKKSEKYGLKVWLCWEHHEGTYGVHGKYGKELNILLKQVAQRAFEQRYKNLEFIKIFGKNYL